MQRGLILFLLAIFVPPGMLGVATASAEEGDDLIALASDHYANQRWELSASSFKAFLKQHPEDNRTDEALYYRAESLLQLGRYPEAIRIYEKFLDVVGDEDPRASAASFRIAEAAYLGGRHSQAVARFGPFLELAPPGEQRLLAETYLAGALLSVAERADLHNEKESRAQHEKLQQARELFTSVLRTKDNKNLAITCRFGLARCEDLLGNRDSAQRGYTALLKNVEPKIAAQAHYYLGRLAFSHDDAAMAAATWDVLLQKWPDTPWADEVISNIPHAHLLSGDIDKARRSLLRWQNVDGAGPSPGQLRHLARIAGEQGETEWSLQLYAQLATEPQPQSSRPAAVQRLAAAQVKAGRVATAAETLAALMQGKSLDPTAATAGLQLAEIYQQLDQPAKALKTYLEVADRWNDSPSAQVALRRAATIVISKGNFVEGAAIHKRLLATELDEKQRAETLYRLGWVLHDGAKPNEAKAQFEALHAHHPESAYWSDATYRLAEYAVDSGDTDRADALLLKLIDQEPDTEIVPHALYLSGQIAVQEGDWKRACGPLAKLVNRFPRSTLAPPAEYWLAESHYQSGNYGEAEQRFAALAEGSLPSEQSALVALRRGQLAAQQDDWPRARSAIKPLLADASAPVPQDQLYYLLGRCRMADAEIEAARTAFIRAAQRDHLEKSETAAMAQWMIGETFMHQERYAEAAAEYFRVVSLYPHPRWQAASLLQAGRCYERRQQVQEAAGLYRQLLQKYPETDFASEARIRLKTLTRADRRPQS